MAPDLNPRPILSAVARLGRRVRAQRAVRAGLWACVAVALGAVVLVALHLAWLLPPGVWSTAAMAGGGVVLAAVLAGFFWRVDPLRTAQRLDAASGLHDRLSTALWLLTRGGEPSALERAQLHDAVQHAVGARPELAAPWFFPREAVVVLALLGGAWALAGWSVAPPAGEATALRTTPLAGPEALGESLPGQLPPEVAEAPPVPPEQQAAIDEAVEALEEKLEAMEAEANPADTEAADALAKMKALLEDLKANRVDETTAMAQLEALEDAAKDQAPTEEELAAAQPTKDALTEAAEALDQALDETKLDDKEMKDTLEKLAEDLKNEDFEKADERLQELMERFMKLPKKDQERLAKMFESLAKKFQNPLQQALDKAKKERDRLGKKDQETPGGLNKKDRDRLKKLDRQIDQLNRQNTQGQDAEKKRELDKLSRDMKNLADQLKRQKEQEQDQDQQANQDKQPEQQQKRPDPRTPEELQKMLERMKQMGKKQRMGKKMEMRAADMKELLKKRRQGKDEGREGKERGGRERGGEQAGKERSDQRSQEWRRVRESMKSEWSEMKPKGGAGAAKAAMTAGGPTELDAKTQETFIEGQQGKGESFTQVLKGAAKQGTQVKGYGEVHIDYSMRAARQMDEEEIPPGYRETVEEYFRLIRER